ncbi:MAG: cellulase family glycosylhydrolase [Candidatus Omnitrophota bacterium]|jgi:hypothetical protein
MLKKYYFVTGILLLFIVCNLCIGFLNFSFAQGDDLEFNIDLNSPTVSLPAIYKPNVDLSGRGVYSPGWPQSLSSKEVVEIWQKDIGFSGFYRIQYNLWEINELAKNKDEQKKLLENYDNVIKSISDSGAVVILDIFGTPAGMGRVLDKKSAPVDLDAFKKLIKDTVRELSCNKKYNIWYEVWNAPDLDDFFLGRQQEYFNLYRTVAQAVKELKQETNINIPVGGPSVSWWFKSLEPNTILTPERSLIYGLIRYCYSYQLPLDFISWHGYSTDPMAEQESTLYHKYTVSLIRDWLTYFRFESNTPIIIDEWNFDRDTNILPERHEHAYIAASYIPARINGMLDSGIDNQVYFSLQDFENKKEAIVRNVGAFENKGEAKAIYNVFRMLGSLGKNMFVTKTDDEFCKLLATKSDDTITLLIYNYIDPQAARNYLSKNIVNLSASERKMLINIIKTDKLNQIISGSIGVSTLHLTKRVEELLGSALEISEKTKKCSSESRNVKINIKNLKENYIYQLYSVDSNCIKSCVFSPREEKEITAGDYSATLAISPYSVNMIVLKVKPKEPVPAPAATVPVKEEEKK